MTLSGWPPTFTVRGYPAQHAFPLAILDPADGAIVSPIFHVIGTAPANATVGLHCKPGPADAVSIATATPAGVYGFTGDNPVAAGASEWWVVDESTGAESSHVHLHVVEG